jgi:hypothetical protein
LPIVRREIGGKFRLNTAAAAAAAAGLALGAASRAGAAPLPIFIRAERVRPGASLSLAEILAQYPTAVSGDIVQYELGFGAAYDKQIGFGNEADGDERLLFVETQVGNGDHACNPNTLKKVYLQRNTFADVFTPYAAKTYVTRSGNMLTRWGDGVGPDASDLLLLDTRTLYDARRATIVRVAPATVKVDDRTIATTHVRANYHSAAGQQLRSVDLWLSAAVPLGLVKMTATAPDVDPFHLSVYKFARHFKTELAMSLTTIRALTPTGDVPVIQ